MQEILRPMARKSEITRKIYESLQVQEIIQNYILYVNFLEVYLRLAINMENI